ncbi:MAG: hypothetical protein ACYDGS_01065 [Thermoleophilia bacterium]
MEGKAEVTQISTPGASPEQKRYGAILDVAMKVGLLVLVATFILYLVGVPKPHVPVGDVSANWSLKVDKYLEATQIEKGWSWAKHLGQSDFLTFAPIAFLASVTVICYLTILPIFFKRKDFIYATLVIAEVMVLVLAASGVLPSGGH